MIIKGRTRNTLIAYIDLLPPNFPWETEKCQENLSEYPCTKPRFEHKTFHIRRSATLIYAHCSILQLASCLLLSMRDGMFCNRTHSTEGTWRWSVCWHFILRSRDTETV